jgi:hypothetical protein
MQDHLSADSILRELGAGTHLKNSLTQCSTRKGVTSEVVWIGFALENSLWQDAVTRISIEAACGFHKPHG